MFKVYFDEEKNQIVLGVPKVLLVGENNFLEEKKS